MPLLHKLQKTQTSEMETLLKGATTGSMRKLFEQSKQASPATTPNTSTGTTTIGMAQTCSFVK